jgi:hypothetical protein
MATFAQDNLLSPSAHVTSKLRLEVMMAATQSTADQLKAVATGGIGFYLLQQWQADTATAAKKKNSKRKRST